MRHHLIGEAREKRGIFTVKEFRATGISPYVLRYVWLPTPRWPVSLETGNNHPILNTGRNTVNTRSRNIGRCMHNRIVHYTLTSSLAGGIIIFCITRSVVSRFRCWIKNSDEIRGISFLPSLRKFESDRSPPRKSRSVQFVIFSTIIRYLV